MCDVKPSEKTADSTQSGGANKDKENESRTSANFECNVCLCEASEPVVTRCGHLFCWECLLPWAEENNNCPVCKAVCDPKQVIPLYGRGNSKATDQSKDLPARPVPQVERPDPTAPSYRGLPHIPPFFSRQSQRPQQPPPFTSQHPELDDVHDWISKVFLVFGALVVLWFVYPQLLDWLGLGGEVWTEPDDNPFASHAPYYDEGY
eukprot:TRINITY_DN4533_c0_g1_i1.p1 TRINITY_DN4533_c0_g1~~TRINITY_DN4533_c0_g1_i1.p1  ORF type:complete len:215 (-),score=4.68 TRINITY_DN4533_c0_g1_i1:65-679(-)